LLTVSNDQNGHENLTDLTCNEILASGQFINHSINQKKYSGHVATDTTARTIEKSYWGKIGEGETKQNEIFIHHNW